MKNTPPQSSRYFVQQWPSSSLAVTLAVATESVREKDPFSGRLADSPLQCEAIEFPLDELTREAAAELLDTVADGRIAKGQRNGSLS